MLELKFEDKIKVWKNLRNKLESTPRPFDSVMQFVNRLPVSAKKVNAWDPNNKVEPWHLIEKEEFTEYEIAQLIAYTLQLTDRFCNAQIEIHISTDIKKDNKLYLVYVDGTIVLGYHNEVITVEELPTSVVSQKIYSMPMLH
tara:strand:+ start:4167 stop:4592 length:426 start_codon:yes stop_codon:yes gene_type:complete